MLKMVIFIKSINLYNIHFLNFENYHKLRGKKVKLKTTHSNPMHGPKATIVHVFPYLLSAPGGRAFQEGPSAGAAAAAAATL